MGEKYSDPRDLPVPTKPPMSNTPPKRLFALDSGSPISSVALAWDGDVLTREFALGDSSKLLLPLLDELLAEVGGQLNQLEGLLALRGPGSFTGLRVGLATVLGFHQALGIPAGTATTFEALAWQARRRGVTEGTIYAAVDALRGEWFSQGFDAATLEPLAEPKIRPVEEIAKLEASCIIGSALNGFAPLPTLETEPLASDLLGLAGRSRFAWNPSELTQPLYLRPPAAAQSARRL